MLAVYLDNASNLPVSHLQRGIYMRERKIDNLKCAAGIHPSDSFDFLNNGVNVYLQKDLSEIEHHHKKKHGREGRVSVECASWLQYFVCRVLFVAVAGNSCLSTAFRSCLLGLPLPPQFFGDLQDVSTKNTLLAFCCLHVMCLFVSWDYVIVKSHSRQAFFKKKFLFFYW